VSEQYPTRPSPPTQQHWTQPAQPAVRPPKPPFYRRGWFPLVTFLAGWMIATLSAGTGNTPATRTVTVTSIVERTVEVPASTTKAGAAPTTTPKVTRPPVVTIGDGMYEVGAEIQPGTYKTRAVSDCYWARLADPDGDNILANHIGTGPMTLRVRSSDKYVELNGGCEWRKVG
jgi:hypothetical protein